MARNLSRRTLIAAAGLPALACLPGRLDAQSTVTVVATFSILADLVSEVAGQPVAVHALVGPESDTHSYQGRPSDAKSVAHAQVLISNGLGFETWLPRMLEVAEFRGKHVVASDGISPLVRPRKVGNAATTVDPHAWQDVAHARRYVANIASGLRAADAANASSFEERARQFDRRLADLDAWVRTEISRVPAEKRKVITGHDAFGYFAHAYGVEFLAPLGMNTESDATALDVAALISMIRAQKVKALFMENLTNPALIRQIAADAGGIVGPTLYSDALSSRTGPASTYEAMMRHNVSALVATMSMN